MGSKVRAVFVTACAVLFLVGAFVRPGGSVTRKATTASATETGHSAPSARAWLHSLLDAVRDNADEIANTGSWYREVSIYNKNSSQEATFRITDDGIVHPEDAAALNRFFACRRSGRKKAMEAGVLAMLVDVARRFDGHTVEIISGYRAKPYGVKKSKHFSGRAIDLRVRGVRLKTVRDYLWRNHQNVGVGYYPHHGFVHMDYRPDQSEAAWTSAAGHKAYRKNPRWARLARR